MKLFNCTHCANIVYFENSSCESCGNRLGYDSGTDTMVALAPDGDAWMALRAAGGHYRFCENARHDVCNWLLPVESGMESPPPGNATETAGQLCVSCRHNQLIPNLSIENNVLLWRKLESARHHLFYDLLRLGLPLTTRAEQPESGLAFKFLADDPSGTNGPVLTGHDEGVITINLAEADDAVREQRRAQMGEPYRTLLGHFRHEIGHYYWDRLVRDTGRLEGFRALFGDERRDYNEALKQYYAHGPLDRWWENFISAYATSHPWEDFAETWAHYFHIVDTLEMAAAYGLRVNPALAVTGAHAAEVDVDPHRAEDIGQLVRRWMPISAAVNSINRCMGQPDLYPFVLTAPVITRLGFVHDLIHGKNAPAGEPLTAAGIEAEPVA